MGKRTRRILVQGGPFNLREIGARVDRMRIEKGLNVKSVIDPLKMSKSDWTKKVNCTGSSFTVGELSMIAKLFEAPEGWPFIDEWQARILENALRRASGEPEATSPTEASPPAQSGKRKAGGKVP